MDGLEARRRIRAIRRLARPFPPASIAERLAQIADLATGKTPIAGTGDAPKPTRRRRKAAESPNRMEEGGEDRSE